MMGKSFCSFVVALLLGFVLGPNANAQRIDGRVGAGEFAAARQAAVQLPVDQRDQTLAEIATAQNYLGESVAAAGTVRGISSAGARQQAFEGAGGGGAFADFQSLMDLIQTTVVPETWEALGGPSTMAPYPQGVYVDAAGTVLECESFAKTDAVADLKSLLHTAPGPASAELAEADWRVPAKLRFVSLRRLLDELSRRQMSATRLSDAMVHLAGLSQVQYLFLEGDDIVLAGPVGGIDATRGWFRDRQTGINTMRLDFLLTTLQSALENQPFGCTIDPTTKGLQQAAAVAAGVQNDTIPIGNAAEEMSRALGMQRVEVFGTAGDTPIGYLMVEADRHMKQLALGMQPMPRGVVSYLDVIDANIAQGPPNDLLLRLWFTAQEVAVRADENRTVFEVAGTPIRLSGQNERAMADGRRGNLTQDFRSQAFVAEFNKHWNEIRDEYPVYGALESVYRAASVSELLRRFADSDEQLSLIRCLASQASGLPRMQATPRQVMTIATLHRVRHGRQIHRVVLASGGVSVDAKATLASIAEYPSLGSVTKPEQSQPRLIQRWWWDLPAVAN